MPSTAEIQRNFKLGTEYLNMAVKQGHELA